MSENPKIDLARIADVLRQKPFRPHRIFRGGHAQTIVGRYYPRRRLDEFSQKSASRLFTVAPETQILARCHWQKSTAAPVLILVHGLEGSSESAYLLSTAKTAFDAGFHVLRLNLRTCGDTEHLTPTLYHSGMSGDLRRVINELIEQDGLDKIYLAGFSLGGNMSLKLAGELGGDAPEQLRGVCAVSPSIDLPACAAAIEAKSNFIYNRSFVASLKQKLRRVQKLRPDVYSLEPLKKLRTVRDFDRAYTAVHGGFRDVEDYYNRSSSLPLIKQIRVPTLIIHAQDDPFIPFDSFLDESIAANEFVILLTPKTGGHVGFLGEKSKNENRFWAENRIVEFCQNVNG